MNNELKDILNIGIPCYNSLEIDLKDFTLMCAKDVYESIDLERRMCLETREKIDKEIDHKTLNYKYL